MSQAWRGRAIAGDDRRRHELLLQIGHRLVRVEIAAAGRQPLPPVLLDADMEKGQAGNDEEADGGERGTPGLEAPGESECEQADDDRAAIAPALPDAELAGLKPAEILAGEGDQQRGDGAQQQEQREREGGLSFADGG